LAEWAAKEESAVAAVVVMTGVRAFVAALVSVQVRKVA